MTIKTISMMYSPDWVSNRPSQFAPQTKKKLPNCLHQNSTKDWSCVQAITTMLPLPVSHGGLFSSFFSLLSSSLVPAGSGRNRKIKMVRIKFLNSILKQLFSENDPDVEAGNVEKPSAIPDGELEATQEEQQVKLFLTSPGTRFPNRGLYF